MNFWQNGDERIDLIHDDACHDWYRILSIKKLDDGKIRFVEQCDGYFESDVTKERAIATLKEAIDWIEARGLESLNPPERLDISLADQADIFLNALEGYNEDKKAES